MMKPKQVQIVSIGLASMLLLGATAAKAASFDCQRAKSANEILICEDAELSRLDDETAKAYKEALSRTADRERLIANQRDAWRRREKECTSKRCLVDWFAQRKSYFAAIGQRQAPGSSDSQVAQPTASQADAQALATMKTLVPMVDEKKWPRGSLGSMMKGLRYLVFFSDDKCPSTNRAFANGEWHDGGHAFFAKKDGMLPVSACWRGPNEFGALQLCRMPPDENTVVERDCELIAAKHVQSMAEIKKQIAQERYPGD